MEKVSGLWSPALISERADAQEDAEIRKYVDAARDQGDEHKEKGDG